ncbi:hypothetical protein ADUPG1_006466 [Aduncisulcus paluster]|uniref:Uncharacterized protein n=1 Tax=Aduncisulcus paluster TaxID=2918883 RepID=A0ABQ5KLS8_9EUKA|nr:hypothetical protein ADUPG1_006466 [Aduncisulcus paluster]
MIERDIDENDALEEEFLSQPPSLLETEVGDISAPSDRHGCNDPFIREVFRSSNADFKSFSGLTKRQFRSGHTLKDLSTYSMLKTAAFGTNVWHGIVTLERNVTPTLLIEPPIEELPPATHFPEVKLIVDATIQQFSVGATVDQQGGEEKERSKEKDEEDSSSKELLPEMMCKYIIQSLETEKMEWKAIQLTEKKKPLVAKERVKILELEFSHLERRIQPFDDSSYEE